MKKEKRDITWQAENMAGSVFEMEIAYTREQMQEYWKYCARRIKPKACKMEKVLALFLQEWDTEEIGQDDFGFLMFKENTVQNFCPEKLSYPWREMTFDMSDAEIAECVAADLARREQAEALTLQELGLDLRGYKVLPTERNLPEMKESFAKEAKEHEDAFGERAPKLCEKKWLDEYGENPARVYFDMTNRNVMTSGLGIACIADWLGGMMGITEEDILQKNPRFMGYVDNLASLGKLPTVEQYYKEN